MMETMNLILSHLIQPLVHQLLGVKLLLEKMVEVELGIKMERRYTEVKPRMNKKDLMKMIMIILLQSLEQVLLVVLILLQEMGKADLGIEVEVI